MKCQNCGKELNPSDKFCDNCGASVIQQPVQPKKKGLKAWQIVLIVLGGIFALIGLFFCFILWLGFTFGTTESETSQAVTEAPTVIEKSIIETTSPVNETIDEANLEENISVDTVIQEDGGYLAAFITNNNEITIDELDLTIKFYDKDNNLIDAQNDGHDMILSKSTVVSQFDVPDDFDHLETDCEIEMGVNDNYENHAKDVVVSHSKGEYGEVIEITNNSDVTIEEIEYIVIFYKDEKIIMVGYPCDIYDLESGDIKTESYYFFGDYDKAEVYINQAHTFQ